MADERLRALRRMHRGSHAPPNLVETYAEAQRIVSKILALKVIENFNKTNDRTGYDTYSIVTLEEFRNLMANNPYSGAVHDLGSLAEALIKGRKCAERLHSVVYDLTGLDIKYR